MSPIDDELRAVLTARAGQLQPSSDLLAGVERRARRIRRNRVAASVAGTALALSAIAVAVPALTPGGGMDRIDTPITATQPPTPSPAVTQAPRGDRPANALDWPASPLTAEDQAYVDQWALEQRSTARPAGEVLYSGQAPDGSAVKAYQLWLPGGPAFTVAMHGGEGGPLVLRSTQAVLEQPAVDAVVTGEQTPYVLVLGRPGTTQVQYAADGAAFRDVPTQDRAAVFERTGPTGADPDLIRVIGGGPTPFTSEIWTGAVEGEDGDPGSTDGEPANLLDWPTRGTVDSALLLEAERAFATALRRPGATVQSKVLFGGEDEAGSEFVLVQTWLEGDDAYTFGYSTGPGREPQSMLRGKTEPDAPVLALLVPAVTGQGTDTLVVVPRPGTGRVLYGEAASEYRPVGEGQDGRDGVVLIERAPGTKGDVLRLLDGDGSTTFDGEVVNLLCRLDGCD